MYPAMAATKQAKNQRVRRALLALAGVRAVLGIIAIPLAPALYRKHFVVLVLMRPTKEVLLAAGFLARRGDVNIGHVLIAAIPLAVFGVWHFFWLGRTFSKDIHDGNLPGWARRILPPKRIKKLSRVLDKKGERVVVMGRLAAFPSALMGAAAGTSRMDVKPFLGADGVGALLSVAEVVVVGYVFGAAYKQAGPWLTGVGVVVLFAGLVYVGRSLRRA